MSRLAQFYDRQTGELEIIDLDADGPTDDRIAPCEHTESFERRPPECMVKTWGSCRIASCPNAWRASPT